MKLNIGLLFSVVVVAQIDDDRKVPPQHPLKRLKTLFITDPVLHLYFGFHPVNKILLRNLHPNIYRFRLDKRGQRRTFQMWHRFETENGTKSGNEWLQEWKKHSTENVAGTTKPTLMDTERLQGEGEPLMIGSMWMFQCWVSNKSRRAFENGLNDTLGNATAKNLKLQTRPHMF
jgi:hypothetical protein